MKPIPVGKQFFQWAAKWFYGEVAEDTSMKPDISSVICLLQAIGFKLCKREKRDGLVAGTEEPVKSETVRVTIECGTSSIVGVLEMDSVDCKCDSDNDRTDGSFGSVSGAGIWNTGSSKKADHLNAIEEKGIEAMLEMSNDVASLVRDVTYRLFKIINQVDMNDNVGKTVPPFSGNTTITKNGPLKEGLRRSYTDIHSWNSKSRSIAGSTSNLTKMNSTRSIESCTEKKSRPKLNRQGTYELEDYGSLEEPRPVPPKAASSPLICQLCTSCGQVSTLSAEEIDNLAACVIQAHQNLNKAVNLLSKKIPSNSSQLSIQEESDSAKSDSQPAPLMSSSFCDGSPLRNGRNQINRSISNASSISSRSSTSISATSMQKPLNRRSGLLGLPPMRERSSSYSVAMSAQRQQKQQSSVSPKGMAAGDRRRSGSTLLNASKIAQRQSSVISKLPAASKFIANKPDANSTLTIDRPKNGQSMLNERRTSPNLKGQSSKTPTRTNTSFIKTPTAGSRLSASSANKFGFSAANKKNMNTRG